MLIVSALPTAVMAGQVGRFQTDARPAAVLANKTSLGLRKGNDVAFDRADVPPTPNVCGGTADLALCTGRPCREDAPSTIQPQDWRRRHREDTSAPTCPLDAVCR